MNAMHTADIYDQRGEDVESIALNFQNVGGVERFRGPARTVRVFEDNGLLKTIMRTPGEGAVLVVDGGGSLACTLLGGNMARILVDNGWAGAVINGAVRDRHELRDLPLGVLAVGSNPKRSTKTGAGEADVELEIGGAIIRPGVMVWADSDGVLVEK